ncbi:MAG TPA: zf-HC2 domain-containing protein [Candidatus Polarisedimenticolia bacterium]|nr:zf-HC2 domain-containing protein [Candidatus Polarisedimenticolia bacterium]
MRQGCRREEAFLLDFYVNGTLRGAERDKVAAHLGSCSRCARQAAEMEQVGRALSLSGAGAAVPVPAAWPRAALAAGALLVLLAAAIGVVMTRGGASPRREPGRVTTLDLGAGGARGAPDILAVIPPEAVFVELIVSLTPEPGAAYALRLFDPEGARIFGPVPLGAWDSFGTARARLPAGIVRSEGRYRVEVEESARAGPHRRYDYHFQVGRAR